jgi:Sec-independent protein translocase protein TatA
MLSLTNGEIALILFIFALTWGAGWLPRVGERLGERSATRGRE